MRDKRRLHCGQNGGTVVAVDWVTGDVAARFLRLRAQHQRVVFNDVAGFQRRARQHQFCACGNNGDARPPVDGYTHMARACQRAQILRAQPVVGRQHQLARHHVLTHRAHVAPGRQRADDLDECVAALLHVLNGFNHDDAVRTGRQRVASVHIKRSFAHTQPHGACFGCAAACVCLQRVAVHGAGVVMRRGDARPHRRRGDAAQRRIQRDCLGLKGGQQPNVAQRGVPGSQRFLHANIMQVRDLRGILRVRHRSTSTAVPAATPFESSGTITVPSAWTSV